jgi:hypothetical protein
MIAAMLLASAQIAWSYDDYDFEYDNFAYKVNEDGTATLVANNYSWSTCSGPVVIPDRVLNKGRYYTVTAVRNAFYGNNSITAVTIGKNIRNIDEYSFYSCKGLTGMLTIPEGVTNIGKFAFGLCNGLTGVSIPKSLKSMGNYAFYDCEGLTAVYITDLAAWCRLRFHSFRDNPLCFAHHLYLNGTEVQNLEIPDDVTYISDYAFYECPNLQSMSTGDGVDTIGDRAFWDCTNLKTITLGKNVKDIKNDAFYNCIGLTDIYSYIMEPFTTYAFTDVSFYEVVTLHVPKGTTDKYKLHYPWYWCTIVEDLVTTEPGDVNGDGKVNVSDVSALINMIMGITAMDQSAADVNGDGRVNVSDVSALINIILGIS